MRSRLGALVVVLGVLGASGCAGGGGAGPALSRDSRPRLAIFGDSISAISRPQLRARLSPGHRLTIAAVHGIDTEAMAPRLESASDDPPDIVVIELGTNDAVCRDRCSDTPIGPHFDAAAVNARFDHFAARFPPTTCTIFVNVNTHAARWGPANAEQIDVHLSTFPRVVDWDGAWQPEWFDDPADPHPNVEGRETLAGMFADKVATCPANHN